MTEITSPARAGNIGRFFLYTALKGLGFGLFTSTWVVYLQQHRHLSLAAAAAVDVSFFVAAAATELPTGIVADRLGRRRSVAIGMALMSVSSLGWALAPSLPLIIAAYVCLGVGYTFTSGADEALFYESVRQTGLAGQYTRLTGRAGATMTAAMAVGSVVGGILATAWAMAPFIVAAAFLGCGLATVLTLHEPGQASPGTPGAGGSFVQSAAQAWRVLRDQPSLRRLTGFLALVPLAALILETLLVQPQALALGVPVVGLGIVVMALQLASVAGSVTADRAGRRLGGTRTLVACGIAVTSGLVGIGAIGGYGILGLYLVISFTTGVLQPIALAQVQEHVTDTARATVLSVQSLLATAVAAFAQPLVGLASDRAGMPAAYFVLAGIVGFGAVLFAARRGPVARGTVARGTVARGTAAGGTMSAVPAKEGEMTPWISPRTA
jgi:MFS family permease